MTFKQMQDAVMAAGGYGEAERTLIKSWLNQTRNDVVTRFPWSWLEKSTAITTVAGTATVALPSDLLLFGRLKRADDNAPRLKFVDDMDPRYVAATRQVNTERGTPMYYTIREGALEFMPVPDAAYNYTLKYWKTLTTDMSADADLSGLPLADDQVLVDGALYRGALYSRNVGLAQFHQDQYEGKLGQMMRNEALRQRETPRRAALPDFYGVSLDLDA